MLMLVRCGKWITTHNNWLLFSSHAHMSTSNYAVYKPSIFAKKFFPHSCIYLSMSFTLSSSAVFFSILFLVFFFLSYCYPYLLYNLRKLRTYFLLLHASTSASAKGFVRAEVMRNFWGFRDLRSTSPSSINCSWKKEGKKRERIGKIDVIFKQIQNKSK